MIVAEIKEKTIWERFLLECEEKTFLDSWNWGEFQKSMGEKIWRIGIFDGSEQIGAVLAVKISARRGTFLFIPHGPTVKDEKSKPQVAKILTKHLKNMAKTESTAFIRIAPIWLRKPENAEIFRG